jgi:hypothetical protein
MNNQFCKTYHLLCFIVFVIILTLPLFSQPKRGKYGISTTISKGFVPSSNISTNNGLLNVGIVYMPSDRVNVRCDLGFRSQSDTSGDNNSEFTFTGNVWYYLNTAEKVSTFLGGALGFGSATDVAGIGTSLVSVSGFFGAEYWFSPHFSWFGHIGLISASYRIAEKPASDVFTSATTGLTWYF